MWTGTWLLLFWAPLSWVVAYGTGYVTRSVQAVKERKRRTHFCDACGSLYDPERASYGGRGAYCGKGRSHSGTGGVM
jgi:ribosomal protein L37AE/L43A